MYILFLGRVRVEKEESVKVIWVGNVFGPDLKHG